MDNQICLDTDFLVNFLRNKKEECDFISLHQDSVDLATTQINVFELCYGAHKSNKKEKNLKAVANLIEGLTILDFSSDAAKKAGEILAELEKKGEIIEFRDLFIGTIAGINGYSIKTGNTKHFSRIKGLSLI